MPRIPDGETKRGTLRRAGLLPLCCASLILVGCAHIPNQFREDGPSVAAQWDSPTALDVKSRIEPTEPRYRDWQPLTTSPQSGAVTHWPLYFEDPFVEKSHGRTDETHPGDVYRLGWEDYVAFPYGLSRYTMNWMFLPVSAVVTPPCTLMESDGKLSRQLLGYDHDATPAGRHASLPAEEPAPASPPAPEPNRAPESQIIEL